MSTKSRPVLLVGSVPLETSAAVFELLAEKLGGLAKRLPDGETGPRRFWIKWQADVFKRAEGLAPGATFERAPGYVVQQYKVASDAAPRFGPLGYAEAAIASYSDFKRLRDAGKIAPGTRFQISLPTPLGVVYGYAELDSVARIWPAYEKRLGEEIDAIVAAILPAELAFQWDIAVEPIYIFSNPERLARFPLEDMVAAIMRATDHVPPEAEIGFHFCFGDVGHQHTNAPATAATLVEFANLLSARIGRRIDWIHLPIPRGIDYDAFLAPLKDLRLDNVKELYLGLLHQSDGVEGVCTRLAAAKRLGLSDFGIATECGFGRRPAEAIPALLDLHLQAAQLG